MSADDGRGIGPDVEPDAEPDAKPPVDDAPPARPPADAEPPLADLSRPVAETLGLTPGVEVARAALNRAKAAARAKGLAPGRPAPRRREPDTRSSARPDGRDPVLVGDALSNIAAERGWSEDLSVGGVIGRWREVVGPDIADHSTPEGFEDGTLVVRADSSNWAATLRLFTPDLLERLAVEVGPDVVREVVVLGPAGPQWGRGPRRVKGRGPRDTYG